MHDMIDAPPALPPVPAPVIPGEPAKRDWFAVKSLWWLVFFDAAWGVEEIVLNVFSWILIPVCFFGTAVPVFFIQKKAGDGPGVALAKAGLLGFLAALPLPVTGTAFGAAMLAWTKLRTDK